MHSARLAKPARLFEIVGATLEGALSPSRSVVIVVQ